MISISQILCPTDFSDQSRHAISHAAALARWYEATLTLLYVDMPVTPYAGDAVPGALLTHDVERMTNDLKELAAAEIGEGVRVRTEVVVGNTASEILAKAEALRADLLVVGTHGRSGFDRLVLGSVTEKVVRKAPCPVLTIPPRAPEAAAGPPLFKRILCAVDFSDTSRHALRYALSLAQEADAQLLVVHALDLPLETASVQDPAAVALPPVRDYLTSLEQERRELLDTAVPDDARTYCEVETVLTHGTPYREILRIAGERAADLVVLGVRGRGAADLLFFGSTANQVVRQASCPVLTIRHG